MEPSRRGAAHACRVVVSTPARADARPATGRLPRELPDETTSFGRVRYGEDDGGPAAACGRRVGGLDVDAGARQLLDEPRERSGLVAEPLGERRLLDEANPRLPQGPLGRGRVVHDRSEEHTSELQ